MRVQLNRSDRNEAFMPNSTTVPVPGLDRQRSDAVVVVLGHSGRVAALAAQLPAGWSVRFAASACAVRPGEIVLISGAREDVVRDARAVLSGRTRIVALVDEDAGADLVTAVLTAGADACVRGGQPAILASHLVACRRRQLADRWLNVP
ncbi:hypothetical protein [Couchioplanes caeruleus]|uniref:Uncharacterized protein n=2 Tax=Couchioplanes caeruleus TaxID=56438 RepID=A0A1K0FFK4_9ACTN|nr:hypothetical protein [Couchioplanes caeruleus]OJF11623.1 hypothetical protein BG844_25215 [Couchioplanes caeruleus subsp. caeruleus]ROP34434.1 hypothetical protein EDD30_7521 [Couchioplanes caeruleus]